MGPKQHTGAILAHTESCFSSVVSQIVLGGVTYQIICTNIGDFVIVVLSPSQRREAPLGEGY